MRVALLGLLLLAGCGGRGDYSIREVEPGVFAITNPDGEFRFLSAAKAEQAGIGIRITLDGKERVTLLEVFPGSPAEAGDLKIGDRLLASDGKSLHGLDVQSAAAAIRGKPGSVVELEIEREGRRDIRRVRRAKEVMRFVEFPQGTLIQQFKKAGLPEGKCTPVHGSCHFLIEAGDFCTYSCPLED